MRLTAHNGRAGKDGAYSAKHNDKNFDTEKTDHITKWKSSANRYWCIHDGMTFEDAESAYYEEHFRKSLDDRNERYTAQRHPERVKTMDEYRTAEKTCPEETILQIGRKDETVEPETLWKVCVEYINWEQKRFPNVKLLDVALHVDEEGAPHIHERKVWIAKDNNGDEVVSQSKALEQMGIERPAPSKPKSKYNNPKMTFTRECREKLFEIAREHGLDLETEPKEHSKTGLSLIEYKHRQEQEKLEQARVELALARSELDELKRVVADRDELTEALNGVDRAIKNAGKTADRIATEDLDLKQKRFGKENEVSLGSVQSLSINLKSELKHIKPLVKTLKEKDEQLSGLITEYESRITAQARKIAAAAGADLDQARKDKAKYTQLKEQEESYIIGKAEDMANKRFDEFLTDCFKSDLDGRGKRLEAFCEDIHLKDGRTILDAFEDAEKERKDRLSEEWEERTG